MKIDWELVITVMACLVLFEIANKLFLEKMIAKIGNGGEESSYED